MITIELEDPMDAAKMLILLQLMYGLVWVLSQKKRENKRFY